VEDTTSKQTIKYTAFPQSANTSPRQGMTPPSPAEPSGSSQSGSGGCIWVTIILLVLLIGGGVAWAIRGELPVVGKFPLSNVLEQFVRQKKPAVALAPIDTAFFLDLDIGKDNLQREAVSQHWNRFPAANSWQNTLLGSFLFDPEAETALRFEADIAPWLGDTFGMIVSPPAAGGDADNADQPMGFFVSTTNREKTLEFIDKLVVEEGARKSVLTYRNETVIEVESRSPATIPPLDENSLPRPEEAAPDEVIHAGYIAFLDDYMVWTNDLSYLQSLIETWQEGNHLGTTADYRRVRNNLPEPRLGEFYYNGSLFQEGLTRLTNPLWLLSGLLNGLDDMAIPPDSKFSTGLHGVAIYANDEGIHLFSYGLYGEGEAGIRLKNFSPALLKDIPHTAGSYLNTEDFGRLLRQYLQALLGGDSHEQSLSTLTSQLATISGGLDLEKDLLSWMEGEYALYSEQSGTKPAFTLMLKVEDRPTAEAGIAKLVDFFNGLISLQLAGIDPLNEEEPAIFELFETSSLNDIPVSTLRYPGIPDHLQLSYAFVGDNLVISTARQGISSAIAVQAGEQQSLLAQADFVNVYQHLPQSLSNLAYLDRSRTMTILDQLFPTTPARIEGSFSFGDLNESLSPIRTIIAYTRHTEAAQETRLSFYFSP